MAATRSGWAWAYTSPRVTPHDTPPDEPAVDTQVLAETLQVGHQVPGGVGREVGMSVDSRPAAAAPSLIEQDDPVELGVEQPGRSGGAAGPRAAVEDDGRKPLGIAQLSQ